LFLTRRGDCMQKKISEEPEETKTYDVGMNSG
jgi:hypothetical protein